MPISLLLGSTPPPPTKMLDLGASLQRRILKHGRWYFFYYKNNAIRPSWTLKHTEVWDETKYWFQGKRLTVAFVFVFSSPFLFLFFSFFAFKMAAPIFLFLLKKNDCYLGGYTETGAHQMLIVVSMATRTIEYNLKISLSLSLHKIRWLDFRRSWLKL